MATMASSAYQPDYKAEPIYTPVNPAAEVPYDGEVARMESRDTVRFFISTCRFWLPAVIYLRLLRRIHN
jgi:hypothetical protein